MCILNRPEQIQTYLVGGAVRDWLLGRIPREYDFVFATDIATFLQWNPSACKVGKSVSVFLLDGQEYMPLLGTVAEDLQRRDLTFNALALDANGVLHSHPEALGDLMAGILRPASATSFYDDTARVFRLARFACEFPTFSVHADAVAQMRAVGSASCFPVADLSLKCASESVLDSVSCSPDSAARPFIPLGSLPAERVGRELLKAFAAPRPSRWFRVLAQGGCLAPWFALFNEAESIPAGPFPYHRGSVFEHLMDVMDAVAGDPLRVWMALCHDIGKISTPLEMLPHHYGHESRGEAVAEQLAIRLGLPARYRTAGGIASLLHMKAGIYSRLRPGTRCDLLLRIHAAQLDDPFWRVVEADSGLELRQRVSAELALVLSVTLPVRWRNKGQESGTKLRLLRCQALRAGAEEL